jgi:hypothetical protein
VTPRPASRTPPSFRTNTLAGFTSRGQSRRCGPPRGCSLPERRSRPLATAAAALGPHQIHQGRGLDEFSDDEDPMVVGDDVEHRDHTGMGEPCDRSGLTEHRCLGARRSGPASQRGNRISLTMTSRSSSLSWACQTVPSSLGPRPVLRAQRLAMTRSAAPTAMLAAYPLARPRSGKSPPALTSTPAPTAGGRPRHRHRPSVSSTGGASRPPLLGSCRGLRRPDYLKDWWLHAEALLTCRNADGFSSAVTGNAPILSSPPLGAVLFPPTASTGHSSYLPTPGGDAPSAY